MENDLISREALIGAIQTYQMNLFYDKICSGEIDLISAGVIANVERIACEAPSVEAEPVRHEGTTTYITTNDLDKYQPRIIVDEGEKNKFCAVYYADNPGWDVFDDLTSSYYGKQMYFTQPDGTIYSRVSCGYMTFEEALSEFRETISMDGGAKG